MSNHPHCIGLGFQLGNSGLQRPVFGLDRGKVPGNGWGYLPRSLEALPFVMIAQPPMNGSPSNPVLFGKCGH
nr:hypothetical protein [uncultured Tateyamaria sp.]